VPKAKHQEQAGSARGLQQLLPSPSSSSWGPGAFCRGKRSPGHQVLLPGVRAGARSSPCGCAPPARSWPARAPLAPATPPCRCACSRAGCAALHSLSSFREVRGGHGGPAAKLGAGHTGGAAGDPSPPCSTCSPASARGKAEAAINCAPRAHPHWLLPVPCQGARHPRPGQDGLALPALPLRFCLSFPEERPQQPCQTAAASGTDPSWPDPLHACLLRLSLMLCLALLPTPKAGRLT
jgi:hypothetical protein